MKLYSLYLTYRNIIRLKEILSVLIKYGFFNIAENTDLKKFIPFYKRLFGKKMGKYIYGGFEVQLRMAFEELGPTFIKLGQMLSRREDLFSETFVDEFSKLEDKVTPHPFSICEKVLQEEYKDIGKYFREINPIPYASASLAQVHSGVLINGEKVVLKIKRPDIDGVIQNDLIVLKFLGRFLEKHFIELSYLRINDIILDFERSIIKELNFFHEVANMEKMSLLFADAPFVIIPKPKKEFCTGNVIVMEDIPSAKLTDKMFIKEHAIDLPELLKKGLKVFLKKLFQEGVYHGDLHMGNIGITQESKIVLYDFGNIGFLTKKTRLLVKDFITTLVTKDYELLTEKFFELDFAYDDRRFTSIERDLRECFESRLFLPVKQLDLPALIKDILEIMRKHEINLPSELISFFKTLLHIETIGRNCIPAFSLGEILNELIDEEVFKFKPKDALEDTIKALNSVKKIAFLLPKRIDKILNKMINDKFTVDFYHMNLEPLTEEIKKSSNRVSVSLIVSALIIGSSLVFFSDKGPHIFGYPLLGISGFVFSFILGIYLLFSIIR